MIAQKVGIPHSTISKVSSDASNDSKSFRGPSDYRSTLIELLRAYSADLKIEVDQFVIGTEYERIVDCKAVINHIHWLNENLRPSGRALPDYLPDERSKPSAYEPNYLLVYWWLRDELFHCVLENRRVSTDKFNSELYFYKIEQYGTMDFKVTRESFSQTGNGEIFNATTSILTIGKGQKDSPHFYRTSFNLKIESDQWDNLPNETLVSGTYSTVSRKGPIHGKEPNAPVSGLLIAEYLTSLSIVEDKIKKLASFIYNKLRPDELEHLKLTLIRQLLFREHSTVFKYDKITRPFNLDSILGVNTTLKARDDFFFIRDLQNYAGKYSVTYINTHGQIPLVEEALLEVFPSGKASLTLPKTNFRNEKTETSQFSIIGQGRLLIGSFAFSQKSRYAKIQFIINCKSGSLDSERGHLYGIYVGVGLKNDLPAIGRVRLVHEKYRDNKSASLKTGYYELSQLWTNDPDFAALILGSKEKSNPIGESWELLNKFVREEPQDALRNHEWADRQTSTSDKIYQNFEGVFELYSPSSHDPQQHVQVFPLYINAIKNRVEIRSRNSTYFGKLRFFESGIIELYFDRDIDGRPHFLHKLFIVQQRKMTDQRKPFRFHGLSTRINRNQALRASQDILMVSNKKWDDKNFVFVEDAMADVNYRATAEMLLPFLKKSKTSFIINYQPDQPLR